MKAITIANQALVLSETDVVATAIDDLEAGQELSYAGRTITLVEDVRFGHKVALEPLGEGEPVVKYGEVIGTTTAEIAAGEWVHTHNCRSNRGGGEADA